MASEEWDAAVLDDTFEDVCEVCGVKCLVRTAPPGYIEYFDGHKMTSNSEPVTICGGCASEIERDR